MRANQLLIANFVSIQTKQNSYYELWNIYTLHCTATFDVRVLSHLISPPLDVRNYILFYNLDKSAMKALNHIPCI